MRRSGNPVLRSDTFSGVRSQDSSSPMTIQGAVDKTFLLLFFTIFSAAWTWSQGANALPWVWPLAIAGFVIALVTIFKKEWAPMTSPLYALCEGAVLGSISVLTERAYPGIVTQAVLLTFGILFSLLLAYKSGLIQATENFKLGVVAATGGIALLYLVDIVMSFFGHRIPMIHEGGWLGIGFSVFVVIIASMNLVLDFDFIEQGAESGAPKYMEWYGAFGLMVTLIWLYLEVLRLLSKSRRD